LRRKLRKSLGHFVKEFNQKNEKIFCIDKSEGCFDLTFLITLGGEIGIQIISGGILDMIKNALGKKFHKSKVISAAVSIDSLLSGCQNLTIINTSGMVIVAGNNKVDDKS
jgi:hypothetical protein